jgi:hypothetical protein
MIQKPHFDPDSYSKIKNTLQEIDTQGFIYAKGDWGEWDDRVQILAEILTITESQGMDMKNITLFEFGAYQHNMNIPYTNNPYHSGISQFFAMYSIIPYFAFDAAYSEPELKSNIERIKKFKQDAPQIVKEKYDNKITVDELFENSSRRAYKELDMDEFGKKIISISRTYEGMRESIKETISKGRTPIVFSTNVLNSPKGEFNEKLPFWNIERCLHVHETNTMEIENRLNSSIMNEDDFKEKFQKYFNIQRELTIIKPQAYDGFHYTCWNTL